MKKSCFYDKEKCESVVIISENGNCYKGVAKTHPDDKECASKYTGLTIADYRAKIERQKRKIKSAKAELKMINSRKAELENYITARSLSLNSLVLELKKYLLEKNKFQELYRRNKNRGQSKTKFFDL